MRFDDPILQEYIETFYGYGNYGGRHWLVGMEEGGGDNFEEVASRVSAWTRRSKPELDDVLGFHRETRLHKWFRPNPPLQPTWNKLIRLLLRAQGLSADTDTVRAYQGATLGRANGPNCLLELLPLPSPSANEWLYSTHSAIPWLQNRTAYREHVAPTRMRHLQERIGQHRPGVVVFYGLGYRQWWEQIVGSPFVATELDGFYVARTDPTFFALTKHPANRGITNQYFERAGTLVSGLLADINQDGRFPMGNWTG